MLELFEADLGVENLLARDRTLTLDHSYIVCRLKNRKRDNLSTSQGQRGECVL